MDKAPLLMTPRTRLRPHLSADFPDCAAIWGDLGTMRFIGGEPQSEQACWFRLLRYGGMWSMQGYGFWAIESRATGDYLGDAGFMDAKRGLPGLDGTIEVGWVLAPNAAGKGLATEVMGAILGWADENLAGPRLACIIDPANAASLNVARKLGFKEVDRPVFENRPIVLLYRARTA